MDKPAVAYAPRPDAAPEKEASALAACYRYILDVAQKRDRLPDKSGPDDTERSKNPRATASIHAAPDRTPARSSGLD